MADNSRIEDLRRRVQKDPASIAFAQLAEEFRRAGLFQESVDACRAGLSIHPGYLSARVTLGRALLELGQLDQAKQELCVVLKSAPENLAAIRGLADIHYKRGALPEALEYYRTALGLARNDPDLEQTVAELTQRLGPTRRPEPKDGLSLGDMQRELKARAGSTPPASSKPPEGGVRRPEAPTPAPARAPAPQPSAAMSPLPPAPDASREAPRPVAPTSPSITTPSPPAPKTASMPVVAKSVLAAATMAQAHRIERDRALRTIAALEQWLDAIHAARAHRTA